jgi:hypothetical protein
VEQLIAKKASNAPTIVKIKGIFFNRADANSASIEIKCSKEVVILFEKRGEPKPITMSFERYPQKILPKQSTINGKAILIGASWACSMYVFFELVSLTKVKKINRKE